MTSPKGPKDWACDAALGAAKAFGTAIFAKTGEKVLNKSTEIVTQKEDITKIENYQKVPVEISEMQPVEMSLKNCVKVDLDVKAAALVGAGVAGGILTAKVVDKLFGGGGGGGGAGGRGRAV